MWEICVGSLGREDPLEKEMAIHSSILAWRIPWMEELGGLQSMGVTKSQTSPSFLPLILRTELSVYSILVTLIKQFVG